MDAADSVSTPDRCTACAGFGWVYVTVKTTLATAPEQGTGQTGRVRRPCRACGDPAAVQVVAAAE